MTDKLWCVEVQGPDDLIAMPSYEEACTIARGMDAFFAKTYWAEDNHIAADVIEWPWSPESHAEDLSKQK